MGMLLRRYHEDTNNGKLTTYEDVKGVAEKVAPLMSEVVEKPTQTKPKKANINKKQK